MLKKKMSKAVKGLTAIVLAALGKQHMQQMVMVGSTTDLI